MQPSLISVRIGDDPLRELITSAVGRLSGNVDRGQVTALKAIDQNWVEYNTELVCLSSQARILKSILSVVPAPGKSAECERNGAGTTDRIR